MVFSAWQSILAVILAIIAAVDVPFQMWQHARDLRMTREEIKEEFKESEGSPETRGRIREAAEPLLIGGADAGQQRGQVGVAAAISHW